MHTPTEQKGENDAAVTAVSDYPGGKRGDKSEGQESFSFLLASWEALGLTTFPIARAQESGRLLVGPAMMASFQNVSLSQEEAAVESHAGRREGLSAWRA